MVAVIGEGGELWVEEAEGTLPALGKGAGGRLAAAFRESGEAGLETLAGEMLGKELPPSLRWWRELAAGCVEELCRTRGEEGAPRWRSGEWADWLLRRPPFPGGERVTLEAAGALWGRLGGAFVRPAGGGGGGGRERGVVFSRGCIRTGTRWGGWPFTWRRTRGTRSGPSPFWRPTRGGFRRGAGCGTCPWGRPCRNSRGRRRRCVGCWSR